MPSVTYEEQAFLDEVRENSPVSTSDVADAVGCGHKTAYYRLKELEDEGKISSKKLHARSLAWIWDGDQDKEEVRN